MTTTAQHRAAPPAPPANDARDAEFLAAMGRHLRDARERRGISRRAVAHDADVSERYLAQLEAGEANASVLLLRSVARALRMPLAFAGLVVIAAMAMAMYELFSYVEKHTTAWAHRGQDNH